MLRSPLFGWASIVLLGSACAPKSDAIAPGTPAPGRSAPAPSASSPSAELGPLPPMATMPPPGVAGSSKASVTREPALAACALSPMPASTSTSTSGGPSARAHEIAAACAQASGMTALGAPLEGRQADKDRAAEHRLHAEAGRCYRVYVAMDPTVLDHVVIARDSAGAVIGATAGAALPEDGAMCFSATDDVTLLVGIGAGEGRYAAEVWRK